MIVVQGFGETDLKGIDLKNTTGTTAKNQGVKGTEATELGLFSEGLLISPNPTNGNFSLRYNAPENGTAIIRISDISGREFSVIQKPVNKGANIIYMEKMPARKAGMYMITVQQGKEIQRGKLLYQ